MSSSPLLPSSSLSVPSLSLSLFVPGRYSRQVLDHANAALFCSHQSLLREAMPITVQTKSIVPCRRFVGLCTKLSRKPNLDADCKCETVSFSTEVEKHRTAWLSHDRKFVS